MSTHFSRMELITCGIPCERCPVGSLSEEEREAVGVVFQDHGRRIGYDENAYPWDDSATADYEPPKQILKWARNALIYTSGERDAEKAKLVAKAVVKVANEGCPEYSEGEI